MQGLPDEEGGDNGLEVDDLEEGGPEEGGSEDGGSFLRHRTFHFALTVDFLLVTRTLPNQSIKVLTLSR